MSKVDSNYLVTIGAECVALALYLAHFHSSSDVAGALGDSPLLHYFRNCEIKNTGLILFLVLTGHSYCNTTRYVRRRNLSLSELTYDLLLAWWSQIRMVLSLSHIYRI